MSDWIKLHRKLLDSRIFDEGNEHLLRLFFWCLLRAEWKDCRKCGRDLRAGQFVTTRTEMAGWLGGRPTTWYKRLQKLSEWGMINVVGNSYESLVTVCNFNTYQKGDACPVTTLEQQSNNEVTALEQHLNSEAMPSLVKSKKIKNGGGDKSPEKSPSRKFTPPTMEEVRNYCTSRKNSIDPEHFVAYYTANGWKQSSGRPIVDWRAAVVTWEKNKAKQEPKGGTPQTIDLAKVDEEVRQQRERIRRQCGGL